MWRILLDFINDRQCVKVMVTGLLAGADVRREKITDFHKYPSLIVLKAAVRNR